MALAVKGFYATNNSIQEELEEVIDSRIIDGTIVIPELKVISLRVGDKIVGYLSFDDVEDLYKYVKEWEKI
jgi:hypothetical protein